MDGIAVLSILGAFLLAPIFICHSLGQSRDRTGWMWGLFLGYLGVLILAIMRPVPPDQRMPEPVWTAETMFPPPPPPPPPPKANGMSGR